MVGSAVVPDGRPVIGFVGPSSAGKTTLLEGVVRALQDRDLWVGVVKHSCHQVHPDQPGKDSARLYAAGADAVALAAANQLVTFVRTPAPPRLSDALLSLPPSLDVVLVEGFSWSRIPRYVVLPPGGESEARFTEPGPVLRTIHAPPAIEGAPPAFPPELIQEIATEIARLAGRARTDEPSIQESQ
jgi:molybdopterin-guanine dinucleotide biosynthesis protein MobB